jgi:hypothetical protein
MHSTNYHKHEFNNLYHLKTLSINMQFRNKSAAVEKLAGKIKAQMMPIGNQ